MITLFTGNIVEALQHIKPQVSLCIADSRGTGLHPMSNVLFRDAPEYNEMLDDIRYRGIDRNTLVGNYMYKNNEKGETHLLAFVNPEKAHEPRGEYCNPQLMSIIETANRAMVESGKNSIVVPYYGKNISGFYFNDFLEYLELTFDPRIKIYVSVSEQYTQRTTLPVLRFDAPIMRTSVKQRIIYVGGPKGGQRVIGGDSSTFRQALGSWMNKTQPMPA